MLPSRPKAVLISLVASYLLSALLLFILTFVLYRLKLKESQIAPAVYALYAISCFAGGLLCGKALRTRRFFWGLLTGVLYFWRSLRHPFCCATGRYQSFPGCFRYWPAARQEAWQEEF